MKFPLTRSDVEMAAAAAAAAAAARYSPGVLREQLSQQTAFAVLTAQGVTRDRAEHIVRRLGGRGAESVAVLFARYGAEAVREAIAGEIR